MKKILICLCALGLGLTAGCASDKRGEIVSSSQPTTAQASPSPVATPVETTSEEVSSEPTTPPASETSTPAEPTTAATPANTNSPAADSALTAPLPASATIANIDLLQLPDTILGAPRASAGTKENVTYRYKGWFFNPSYLKTTSKPESFVHVDVKDIGVGKCGFPSKKGMAPTCALKAKDGLILVHGSDTFTLDEVVNFSTAVAHLLGAK